MNVSYWSFDVYYIDVNLICQCFISIIYKNAYSQRNNIFYPKYRWYRSKFKLYDTDTRYRYQFLLATRYRYSIPIPNFFQTRYRYSIPILIFLPTDTDTRYSEKYSILSIPILDTDTIGASLELTFTAWSWLYLNLFPMIAQ